MLCGRGASDARTNISASCRPYDAGRGVEFDMSDDVAIALPHERRAGE